jgi:signal peptidase I
MGGLAGQLRFLAIAAVITIAAWFQQNYSIRTVADDATLMEPSVRRRSVQLFRTDPALPARGSIVWFEHPSAPGKMLIARAVGLPGDRIGLDDGRLRRDGAVLAEDYAQQRVAREDVADIPVPEGTIYVLNDKRDDPMSAFRDSRRLGPIPLALVVGKLPDPIEEKRSAARRKARVRD